MQCAEANYEKNDHNEKRGVCCTFFSSCYLLVSQHCGMTYVMATEHDEKRRGCFSSCSGSFNIFAGFGYLMSIKKMAHVLGIISPLKITRPAKSARLETAPDCSPGDAKGNAFEGVRVGPSRPFDAGIFERCSVAGAGECRSLGGEVWPRSHVFVNRGPANRLVRVYG